MNSPKGNWGKAFRVSCNGRWCLSRRQMEHKSLLKYSFSIEKLKRRKTRTVLQLGEEKKHKHQHLCIRKKSIKKMWSNSSYNGDQSSAPQPPPPAIIITINIAAMGLYIFTISTHTLLPHLWSSWALVAWSAWSGRRWQGLCAHLANTPAVSSQRGSTARPDDPHLLWLQPIRRGTELFNNMKSYCFQSPKTS